MHSQNMSRSSGSLESDMWGGTPVLTSRGSPMNPGKASIVALQQHVSLMMERFSAVAADLQKQRNSDVHLVEQKLQQFERKLEIWHNEWSKNVGSREKFADVHGSVRGVFEEVQALARRMEIMEERFHVRTVGVESWKQHGQHMEQQLQAVEHQSRLAAAALEETQKRQTSKLKHTERCLDDLSRRMALTEEAVLAFQSARSGPGSGRSHRQQFHGDLEDLRQRVCKLEQDAEEGGLGQSLKHLQVTICDVALQVGELEQRMSHFDDLLSALHEKVDQHEEPGTVDAQGSRHTSALVEHLLELESSLENAEESGTQVSLRPEPSSSAPSSLGAVARELVMQSGLDLSNPDRREEVDQALRRLQATCWQAEEDIAHALRTELLHLQVGLEDSY